MAVVVRFGNYLPLSQPAKVQQRFFTEQHRPWARVGAAVLASRGVIWMVGLLSLRWTPKGAAFAADTPKWDVFTRWDALWYLDLARDGYYFTSAGEKTNVVFFPLYPLLVRAASLGGALDGRMAGYLVSTTCLWIACGLLWRLVWQEWKDPRLAMLSVLFLLFSPVSFFFSSIYSEALFLPLTVGCILFARQHRWWLAGALGACAALTRFVGVVLVVPLLWEYVASLSPRGARGRPAGPQWLACLLPLAGMAVYSGYMLWRFGDPWVYFHGQNFWGRHFSWFFALFARPSFTGQPIFYQVWFFATVFSAFILLGVAILFRVPTMFVVYGVSLGFVFVSARFVEGLPRYFSVIFPLYITLAHIARRWPSVGGAMMVLSAGLLALSVTLFANGYWFT